MTTNDDDESISNLGRHLETEYISYTYIFILNFNMFEFWSFFGEEVPFITRIKPT